MMHHKRQLLALLATETLPAIMAEIREWPPRRVVSPLIAALCRPDGPVKWHALSALGEAVSRLAGQDREAARTVIRRLMWSLNDESGGVGWGAPEALGEIMAVHEGLAEEYGHLLVAYLRRDGCYLELPALQRGLLWGIGRLAEVRPALLRRHGAPVHLPPYLDSPDPEVRGLAARATGILQVQEAAGRLRALRDDPAPLSLYDQGTVTAATVGMLAADALARLARGRGPG